MLLVTSAAQQAVEAVGRTSWLPAKSSPSPVVKYHGLARRNLTPLGFLMRPLLNGGTLGGRSGWMSLTKQEQADVFALTIVSGLQTADQAIDWARDLMMNLAEPSVELVEIAGAIRPHPLDVVGLLRNFPGERDHERVFRAVLAQARDLLRRQPDAFPVVTRALEQMAQHGQVPESLAGACFSFDDQRVLAEDGVYGAPKDVYADLLSFLAEEARTEAT
jgi:hypothetical protein